MNLHKSYPKGRAVVWWGFSSCTSSAEVLQAEQFLGKIGDRTMFHIQCLSGKDIRRHSLIPMEDEILLLPGRQLQVTSYLDSGNGLHFIQMKEIEPPYDLIEPLSIVSIFLSSPLCQLKYFSCISLDRCKSDQTYSR